MLTYTDQNDSVFQNTFDPLGRKTAVAITPAAGVGGTMAQAFQFDGLSRATFARDSTGGANADVTTVYDSLDRLLEESQTYQGNTRNVTNSAFTSVPVAGFTFPNDRQLTNVYDPLYRRTQVQETSDSSNIASWQFFGPGRVAEVTLGNGLICTWMNNARTNSAVQAGVPNPAWGDPSSDRLGYDGSGRAITKRYLAGGISGGGYNTPTAVVGCTTEYDRAGNKFFERHLHAENRSHLYEPFDANQVPQGGYDSLDRLRQYQRGNLASTGGFNNAGGGSIATPIALPGTDNSRTYQLDGVGNWRRSVFTPEASPSSQTEVRQHNALNQITRIQNGASQTNLSYDGTSGHSNGNLSNDGTRTYTWDALNRLLQVNLASSGALLAQYAYDALNRRIRKVLSGGGLSGDIPNGTTDFLYLGWQCVEEHDGSDNPTVQYVWGIYLDEIIQQQLLVSLNGFSAGAFYPLQDLLYRTTGFADANRVVREAYDTDAYGNTLIFRNGGSPPPPIVFDSSDSPVDYPTCPFVFTGQRFDAETALYYYKRRFYLPPLGRVLSMDPVGFDPGDINPYGYCGSDPLDATDPNGLAKWVTTTVTYKISKFGNVTTIIAPSPPPGMSQREANKLTKEALDKWMKGKNAKLVKVIKKGCPPDTTYGARDTYTKTERKGSSTLQVYAKFKKKVLGGYYVDISGSQDPSGGNGLFQINCTYSETVVDESGPCLREC